MDVPAITLWWERGNASALNNLLLFLTRIRSSVSWAFEKHPCSQGAHKPGFRSNTIIEDTKQSREESKMVAFILGSAVCSVLSVFAAGVKSSHNRTAQGSQAMGTSGGAGDTWCLYQTKRGRAPNFSPLNGCQKPHLTVSTLRKTAVFLPFKLCSRFFVSVKRKICSTLKKCKIYK